MRDPRWKFVDAEGETLAAEHTPVALAFGLGCPNEAVVGMYRFPGAVIWLQVNAIPLTEPGETHPHTVICTLIDITGCRLAQSTLDGYVSALSENTILQELQRQEVEQLRIRVKELEGRDGLTGLIGHGSFQRILAEAVLREAVSVILIGIDEFRSFNRQFGHEKGDAVLRQITEIIVGVLPDPECTCRYGGDRFAAVLPGATEPDGFGSGQRSRRNDPELQVAS
jgi:GGDEF domain-containing protein